MFSSIKAVRNVANQGFRKWAALLLTLVALIVPTISFASAEANVKLVFTPQDMNYLYASLAFGILAIVVGLGIRSKVMALPPGDEKMQEVGGAIRDGALAYLKQQFKTMLFFVAILAVLLYFMYQQTFEPTVAMFTAVAFMLGVGASYFAGYMGMDMAVNGNMRTANAALTSYKNSLETAFKSGSVAGLLTVGAGLLGATIIFIAFKENATKILVGFGFGGSLAALFMRVGGGIFTKAADVGADLVGKVEAGIPEDDPRNAAVIADNVGDNVGDCAGMAADVFESYEVTLVAAIVLGAATAAIFPQEIWMKLILFAMMARGVGIFASILGIYMVKGSDDLNSDPLQSIRRGFYGSAVVAGILSMGLAYFMLGDRIQTSEIVSPTAQARNQAETILRVQKKVATSQKKEAYEIKAADISKDPEIVALKLPEKSRNNFGMEETSEQKIATILTGGRDALPAVKDFKGYTQVTADSTADLMGFAVLDPDQPETPAGATPPDPKFITLGQYLKSSKLEYFKIKVGQPKPGADGKPDPNGTPEFTEVAFGPVTKAFLDDQLKSAKAQAGNSGATYEVVANYPTNIYANESGDVVVGVDATSEQLDAATAMSALQIMKTTPEKAAALMKDRTNPNAVQPPVAKVEVAYLHHKRAEWWKFGLCVLFGIGMAFVFEWLTDYYVSLHKRPVQELGEVATAGPAPMIITGFAYAQESSVFSLLAIVLSLMAPLMIFPPADYGGYILSFYGIALVGLGLLTTTGFILAMDTFGPISDNAQGVFEMSGAGHDNPDGARRVQLLDAAGNTTKALTKGFAIATAVVAAVALFHAYVEEGKLTEVGMRLEIPEIFLGLLIGGAAPYLFSAFSINAVGRAAFELINEVRAQFKADPGIMAGTSKPNYAACVQIVTKAAQTELLGPGILAVCLPLLVAFGLAIGKPLTTVGDQQYNLVGAQALGGFLVGAILSGQLLAVLLANAGGMWDNSKKLIEDGLHGGKGTEAHKAAVVCDTVGDPFKDTAGPALNPLIKVMNLVALLLAPLVIMPFNDSVRIGITIGALMLLAVAVWWSKRGGMGAGMSSAKSE